MNCCDYTCNQGRYCHASVANIGQRHMAAKPLPPATWRRHLPDLAKGMLFAAIVAVASVAAAVIVLVAS